MKPRRVEMQAFGPYLEKTKVDFTLLYDSRLFLITGPTGCGKTSILDAMSYSLYGRATGSVRDVRDMRNTSAPKTQDTRVEFEFSLGCDLYRFERIIHIREKKLRAGGTEEVIDYEASCWRRGQDDWELICSGSAAVRDKAAEILGLSYEQFSQVVVLPQGEFRKLLTANSTEKQKILETLFGTQCWQKFLKLLTDQVKQMEAGLTTLRAERDAALISAGAASEEELRAALEAGKADLLSLGDQIERLNREWNQSSSVCQKAARISVQFEELGRAGRRREELAGLTGQVEDQKRALDIAQKALGLLPYLRSRYDAAARLTTASGRLETTRLEFDAAARASHEAEKGEKQAGEISRRAEQGASEIARLESMLGPAKNLAAAREKLREATDELNRSEASYLAFRKEQEELTAEIKEIQSHLDLNFKNFLKPAPKLKEKKAVLEAEKESLSAQRLLAAKIDRLESDAAKKGEELQAAAEETEAARRSLALLEAISRDAAAWKLSQDLEDGLPCPVCGALSHPEPARTATNAPTKAQLEAAGRIVEETGRKYERIFRENAALSASCEEQKKQMKILKEKKREAAYTEEDIERELPGIEAGLRECVAAESRQTELERDLKIVEDRLTAIRPGLETALKSRDAAALSVSALSGSVQELSSAVPEELRSYSKLTALIAERKCSVQADSDTMEHIRKSSETARNRLASAQAHLDAASEAKKTADSEFETVAVDYEAKLLQAGFSADDDVQALSLDEKGREAIADQVQAFDRERYAVEEKVNLLKMELENIERPDMEALETALRVKREELDAAVLQTGGLQARVKALEDCVGQLESIRVRSSLAEDKYSLYSRICRLAGGENPQKTPIHQFVLGIMLEDILACANQRLRILSRGRYSLIRSEEPARGGGAKGLELSVNDAWQGGIRGVSTLSGGEMFLASLSLAFGLSDMAQSYAGGIRLDSIFIDEGFGSLDSETLDTAMTALQMLQNGDSERLIGIISHVDELKERIPARIEVKPGSAGTGIRIKTL